ncbi:MAG: threonine/serine exporter family protein [Wenzhouxiangellaceae bacterium]|nr:threonine/serine exporter family protein [Wenzhouxiangellaceae bacterium]
MALSLPFLPIRAIVDSTEQPSEQAHQPYESSPYATLVLNFGRALLRVGSPAHRLEAAMQVMADRLGLIAEFFSTPTALIASLGDGERQQTYLARVEPGGTDLGKLTELSEVMESLARGDLDPIEADRRVREIDQRAPNHRGFTLLAAYVLVSAGACVLIGGGWREMILGGLLGGVTGTSVVLLWQHTELSHLLKPLSATLVTLIGSLWCGIDPKTALVPSVIAGMITLVPGMDLTAATRELATGHQVSGAARLASTIAVFALLALGLALGGWAARLFVGPIPMVPPSDLPTWLLPAGLAIAALGFVILFQAFWKDWIWIFLACLTAWAGSSLGGILDAPVLGAFIGALLVGLAGNLFARFKNRPGSIMHLPGLILLVPGSMGMRSLSALVSQDIISGLETAFLTGMIAVALTTGLILASALIPPKISL